MLSRLKVLGVTFIAISATFAVGASVAHAETEFVGTEDSALKGVHLNTQTWIFNKVTITCPSLTATGTLETNNSTKVTLAIAYQNCKLGGKPAVIEANNCVYTFTGSGEVHLECGKGETVEIIATEFGLPICTVSMFDGSNTGSKYSNETNKDTGKKDVRIFHSMSTIEFQEDAGKKCGVGQGNNGEFGGEITMTATNTAGSVDRDIEVN